MKSAKTFLSMFALTCLIAGTAVAAEMVGNPATGATLYETCVPCHGLNGKDIAGMKVENIMGAFEKVSKGTFTEPLKIGMQDVVKKLNEQQRLDVATYINKM